LSSDPGSAQTSVATLQETGLIPIRWRPPALPNTATPDESLHCDDNRGFSRHMTGPDRCCLWQLLVIPVGLSMHNCPYSAPGSTCQVFARRIIPPSVSILLRSRRAGESCPPSSWAARRGTRRISAPCSKLGSRGSTRGSPPRWPSRLA